MFKNDDVSTVDAVMGEITFLRHLYSIPIVTGREELESARNGSKSIFR